MIDRYLQYVRAHAYVVLEIECCKFVGCFVLFLSFAFEKFMLCFVRSIKYLIDFWFCSITYAYLS